MSTRGYPEGARFELLEPVLLSEDFSLWKADAEAAASFFDVPSAAIVVGSSWGLHAILGQVGLGRGLAAVGAVAANLSPARGVMAREGIVTLDLMGARVWGLEPWLQASGNRGLVAASLHVGAQPVGALVLGLAGSSAPASWMTEGVGRLAQDISQKLEQQSQARLNDRTSGVTVVDPDAARQAAQSSLRRMSELTERLAQVSPLMRNDLTKLNLDNLRRNGPLLLALHTDACQALEHLHRRINAALSPSQFGQREAITEPLLDLARGLAALRPFVQLSHALGLQRLSREQGTLSLRLLGVPRSPETSMVGAMQQLEAMLGDLPSSGPRLAVG